MELTYPSPAFYFQVEIAGTTYSFKEVDGISIEMDLEEIAEGGENGFKHKVPTRPKFGNLELKRGLVAADSMLGQLCSSILLSPVLSGFTRVSIIVHLLDESGSPSISWSFADAWPIGWNVGKLDAMENSYTVESLKFSYSYFTSL